MTTVNSPGSAAAVKSDEVLGATDGAGCPGGGLLVDAVVSELVVGGVFAVELAGGLVLSASLDAALAPFDDGAAVVVGVGGIDNRARSRWRWFQKDRASATTSKRAANRPQGRE